MGKNQATNWRERQSAPARKGQTKPRRTKGEIKTDQQSLCRQPCALSRHDRRVSSPLRFILTSSSSQSSSSSEHPARTVPSHRVSSSERAVSTIPVVAAPCESPLPHRHSASSGLRRHTKTHVAPSALKLGDESEFAKDRQPYDKTQKCSMTGLIIAGVDLRSLLAHSLLPEC